MILIVVIVNTLTRFWWGLLRNSVSA